MAGSFFVEQAGSFMGYVSELRANAIFNEFQKSERVRNLFSFALFSGLFLQGSFRNHCCYLILIQKK
jgi:hypothetical protein